jgi:Eukaryotic-type carbonic anhydrase
LDVVNIFFQLGSIAIFLEAYDEADDWPELNRVICGWREAEDKTRASCGLPSVEQEYPGCFYYNRGHSTTNDTVIATQGIRRSQLITEFPDYKPAVSAYDVIMTNIYHEDSGNTTYEPKKLEVESSNMEGNDDFDWEGFIAEQYKKDEELKKQDARRLMNYEHVPWFNYFPMLAVRTEYFYRYSGTQTIPPCYGKFISGGGRRQTNHWRVFKDPIRISKRQIDEMHRLMRERIAPKDSRLKACKKDTAAAKDPTDPSKIIAARPVMATHDAHFKVYCECINWKSKWKEDQNYCKNFKTDQSVRFFDHPYNFDTVGF